MHANKKTAAQFLSLIDASETRWCFAFYHDKKEARLGSPHLFGSLDQHWPEIEDRQAQGYAFYFVPNKIKNTSNRRTKEDVETIRTLTLDFDQKHIEVTLDEIKKLSPRPHIIVESSPWKYHAYWRVDGMAQDDAERINRNMAYSLNADRGAHTSDHVYRVAGGIHQKNEPFAVRVVASYDNGSYVLADFNHFKEFKDPRKVDLVSYQPVACEDDRALAELFLGSIKKRERWWSAKFKKWNEGGLDRSRYDYCLAGLVRQDGLPIEVFDVLVKLWHGKHSAVADDKAERKDYIQRTWAAHIRDVEFVPPVGNEAAETSDNRRRDILMLLGMEFDSEAFEDDRPQVYIKAHEIDSIVSEVADTLGRERPNLYHRSGELVHAVSGGNVMPDQIAWATNALTLHPVTLPYLKRVMSRYIRWYKFAKVEDDWVPAGAYEECAKMIMGDPDEWNKFPRIRTVTRSPLITLEGRVLDQAGYDEDTCIVYEPLNGGRASGVKTTKKAAKEALGRILDVFKDFPFKDEASRAVVVAACLTPFVRPFLRSAPMFIFNAPQPGTGKSLIAKLAGIITTGVAPSCISQPADDDASQKLIGALLLYGTPVTLIDNIARPLDGDTLNTALTEERIRLRRLGVTETVEVPTATTWYGTGNKVRIKGDLRRRILMATIDANMPNPENRQFDYDVVNDVMANREQLATDCLTILSAYFSSTKSVKLSAFGGFEQWSESVRATLLWLGMADPLDVRDTMVEAQSEGDVLHSVLDAWSRLHGHEEVKTGDVFENGSAKNGISGGVMSADKDFLPELVREMGDCMAEAIQVPRWHRLSDLSSIRIGRYLARNTDQFVGNFQLTRRRGRDNAMRWKLHF